MRYWNAALAAAALCGMLATGCAKSANSGDDSSATSGAVTGSASSGVKAAPAAAGALGNAEHGLQIFAQNCAACHGQAGVGGGIGPVLKGEKARKNFAAAVLWIKNPQPPMPKLYPSPLSKKDVADVAAYVESL